MAVIVRSSGGPQRPTTRSISTQTDLTWPEDQKDASVIPSPACTSSHTQTLQRTSPQASTSSGNHAEGRGPTRPPRKNQQSPPPAQLRERQQSLNDRPSEGGLK